MFSTHCLPHLAVILLAAAAFAPVITAQTIIPSAASATFPQCALACSQLIEAQNNCIPPAAPATDQATYNGCFCQSALLAQLRLSPDGTCDPYCPVESDRQLLQSWYTGFCASQTTATTLTSSVVIPASSTITSGVSTVIVILPPSSSSSGTSSSISPTVTGSGTGLEATSSSKNSWIDTHWRWILMVGILLVGLGLIAILAVCLKRRHRRKVAKKRATLSGFPAAPPSGRNRTPTPSFGPELWGPHQHMAHTRGWEYNHEAGGSSTARGASGPERKSKRVRREASEKGGSRGDSRNRTSAREMGDDVPSVVSEMSKVQDRRAREQERERARNRDQYAEHRAQSMRGAMTAFERDKHSAPRSQTMREKDRIAWQDPEKIDRIEKI